jgi:hypothetical protein
MIRSCNTLFLVRVCKSASYNQSAVLREVTLQYFSGHGFQVCKSRNVMAITCVPNAKITSLWRLWQGDYDVSATLKTTEEHGLVCHFGDEADLNL